MVSKYKFINANLLQPADIILSTHLYSKDTKKIGLLTAGKYSHAALVIDPLLHFESITTGVGFSPLYIEKVEDNGNQKKWLWDISSYKHIDVYRHKDIHRNNDLAFKLIDVVYSIRGLEYPELYKLSGATGLFRRIPFIREVFKILMRRKDKTNPGMFCSQLVKFCLDEIGYPPLLIDMDNTEVNPNHLSNKNISNLEIVGNIKCNENCNIGNDEMYQKSLSHRVGDIEKRYEKLAGYVKRSTNIKQQIDAVSTASSIVNEITEELLDSNKTGLGRKKDIFPIFNKARQERSDSIAKELAHALSSQELLESMAKELEHTSPSQELLESIAKELEHASPSQELLEPIAKKLEHALPSQELLESIAKELGYASSSELVLYEEYKSLIIKIVNDKSYQLTSSDKGLISKFHDRGLQIGRKKSFEELIKDEKKQKKS